METACCCIEGAQTMLKIRRVVLNFLSVNCYLIWNTDTKRTLIVDPGSSENLIFKAIESEKLTPEGILLTHAHVDHISAVPEVSAKYSIPVWLHPGDHDTYFSPDNALTPWMEAKQGLPQLAEKCPDAGLDFNIIHTPGHSKGSCCFYFPKSDILISGDTLFHGCYGRTDFYGGSEKQIFESIKGKLLTLPEETKVLPGHEEYTTIGEEKDNPLYN